jgi:hypothetical protein
MAPKAFIAPRPVANVTGASDISSFSKKFIRNTAKQNLASRKGIIKDLKSEIKK